MRHRGWLGFVGIAALSVWLLTSREQETASTDLPLDSTSTLHDSIASPTNDATATSSTSLQREEISPATDGAPIVTRPLPYGLVVDDAGTPIVNAQLFMTELSSDRLPRLPSQPGSRTAHALPGPSFLHPLRKVEFQTDDDGQFTIPPELARESVLFLAKKESYLPGLTKVDLDHVSRITLTRFASVVIRVLDDRTSALLHNAEVSVSLSQEAGEFPSLLEEPPTIPQRLSDSSYRVDSIPIGSTLQIWARPELATAHRFHFTPTRPGPQELDLRIDLGKIRRGRVVDALTGEPLLGAIVSHVNVEIARSRAGGTFEIHAYAHDERYSVNHPRYFTTIRKLSAPTDDANDGRADADVAVFPMLPSAVIRGRLTDGNALPIGYATIQLIDITASKERVERPIPRVPLPSGGSFTPGNPSTETNLDGTFSLKSIDPYITYELRATWPGGIIRRRPVVIDPSNPNLWIDLQAPLDSGFIDGTVTLGGKPVAAALRWHTDRGYGSTITDQDGNFALTHVPAGAVMLEIEITTPNVQRTFDVVVPANARLHRDFPLESTPSLLAGHVLDENGDPVAGARVEAIHNGHQGRHITESDEQGRFRLQTAFTPNAVWRIVASARGVSTTQFNIAGGSEHLEFLLPAARD